MAWSISDLFPPWGDTGERPSDNFNYQGGDQVNEKHLDYLWDAVGSLEDEVRAALNDIDSDGDGVVDNANQLEGNSTSQVRNHAPQSHDNTSHSANYTTLTEVNSNADVPNADYADQAGNADTVDGQHASDLGSTISDYNIAHTFSETNVTVNTTNTRISGETVGLYNQYLDRTSYTPDFTTRSSRTETGVVIEPNFTMSGIRCKVNDGLSGSVTSIYIVNDSTGNEVASDFVSNGSIAEFPNTTLQGGQRYRVYITGDYDGQFDDTVSFPITDTAIDVVDGWEDGSTYPDYYNFDWFEAYYTPSSGTASIEWTDPDYLREWNIASFDEVLDGGNVDVYIDEDDGTGYTEVAGPISKYDKIPADRNSSVRLRFEFSSSSDSENPHIRSASRSYLL